MHVAVRSRLLVSGESDVLLDCLINLCLSEGLFGNCKARHLWGVKVLTVRRSESTSVLEQKIPYQTVIWYSLTEVTFIVSLFIVNKKKYIGKRVGSRKNKRKCVIHYTFFTFFLNIVFVA